MHTGLDNYVLIFPLVSKYPPDRNVSTARCYLSGNVKKNTRKLPQEFMYYKELEDTKGVIRIRISKTDRHYNSQAFEDTKGVIRIRIPKKNRQRIWML
jgi:hypothetical protein